MFDKITPNMVKLLQDSGSNDEAVSRAALTEIAKAVSEPLRQGLMSGDILFNIFESIPLGPGAVPKFELDFLAPGTERDFVAYTLPNHGYIPQRTVEGDYVMLPTYYVGASIDWLLAYARDARWDVIRRATEVMNLQFTKKMNDDGWHTILSAGVDRNILVFDNDAQTGQFTKRLVSLMKTIMRRNGGGNSTSMNRSKLTDLFTSPEAQEDIRNWNVDQVDETTRREILVSPEGTLNRIFQVNLHDLDELGVGQEYELYYTNTLSGTHSGDEEIVVGLDLSKNDSFVMPVRENVQVFVDPNMHRERKAGLYGWAEIGFGVLDSRRCLIGSF
jgi:hypothetical protein